MVSRQAGAALAPVKSEPRFGPSEIRAPFGPHSETRRYTKIWTLILTAQTLFGYPATWHERIQALRNVPPLFRMVSKYTRRLINYGQSLISDFPPGLTLIPASQLMRRQIDHGPGS